MCIIVCIGLSNPFLFFSKIPFLGNLPLYKLQPLPLKKVSPSFPATLL